jgi:hypothetical protein
VGSKGKNGGRDITLANWRHEETGMDGERVTGFTRVCGSRNWYEFCLEGRTLG